MFQNRKAERQKDAAVLRMAENQSRELRRLTGSILLPDVLFNSLIRPRISWTSQIQDHKESLEQALEGSKLIRGQLIKLGFHHQGPREYTSPPPRQSPSSPAVFPDFGPWARGPGGGRGRSYIPGPNPEHQALRGTRHVIISTFPQPSGLSQG